MVRSARMWRLVALLSVFAMLAVACSRTPPGQVSVGEGPGDGSQASEFGEADTGAGFGSDGSAQSGSDAGETGDPGGTTGGSDGGGTGSATTGGTTTGGDDGGSTSGDTTADGGDTDGGDTGSTDGGTGGTPASGPGIDGDTIKIVFHWHFEDCPDQSQEPNDNTRQKTRLLMDEYVKFFNEYVLADHGWQLEHSILDDGGYYCPERSRATGLQIAKEIQPFATLGVSATSQGPVIADVVTRAGIIHAGGNWRFSADEAARHPYAWNLDVSSEKAIRFMVGWMQRRIQGTEVEDRSLPGEQQVPRVYGILGLDEQGGRELAKVARDDMVSAGFDVAGTYLVSPDSGVASQQAPSTVAKMRDDGVNTLVWALQFGGGKDFYIPFTETMDKQNYLPDIVLGTGGHAFFEQLAAKRVWANVIGTSSYPPITLRVEVEQEGGQVRQKEGWTELAENADAYIEAWQEKLGHNDLPYDGAGYAYDIWSQLSFLATGVIHHTGDALNATTFAEGVESAGSPGSPNRCTVGRFMGRDYEHAVSWEWNAEHDGGIEGFTTTYWVNRQKDLTTGYYESFDNYVYFQSPEDIPADPSHDTGAEGPDVQKQERIGLKPWKSCDEFPDYPR